MLRRAGSARFGSRVDDQAGIVAGDLHQRALVLGMGDAEAGRARLAGAEDLAAAAEPQVLLGDDGSRPRSRA